MGNMKAVEIQPQARTNSLSAASAYATAPAAAPDKVHTITIIYDTITNNHSCRLLLTRIRIQPSDKKKKGKDKDKKDGPKKFVISAPSNFQACHAQSILICPRLPFRCHDVRHHTFSWDLQHLSHLGMDSTPTAVASTAKPQDNKSQKEWNELFKKAGIDASQMDEATYAATLVVS